MTADPRNILIASYDYPLPPERIAQFPLDQRDQSKVLVYNYPNISEGNFSKITEYLPDDSVLIFNDTRVVHARILLRKTSGSQIEIFCLEPAGEVKDIQLALQQRKTSDWSCLIGNSRRWKTGVLSSELMVEGQKIYLDAERLEKAGAFSIIRFDWAPGNLSFAEILEGFGKVPLPPYIIREATELDEDHYQTVYAIQDGSVAAPTAGLHFTNKLLQSLEEKGMSRINFSLHVGAGTFRPVVSEHIGIHEMHKEQVYMELDSLKKLYHSLDRPIVLVGTTSARMMESLYWHGVKLIQGLQVGHEMDIRQWDPYEFGISTHINRKQSLEKVIEVLETNGLDGLSGNTKLIIAPGYKFRYPDVLITNFHQPRSTLLLLVAAFIGDNWKTAYQFALDHDFRFLSYGDSCLFYKD